MDEQAFWDAVVIAGMKGLPAKMYGADPGVLEDSVDELAEAAKRLLIHRRQWFGEETNRG